MPNEDAPRHSLTHNLNATSATLNWNRGISRTSSRTAASLPAPPAEPCVGALLHVDEALRAPYLLEPDLNRIAIFARSRNQARIQEQLELCREFAGRMGLPWQTASVFADRSRSGFDDADKRPVYGDLLAQIRAGRCDLVIVTELIILTADMTQFAALLELVRGGYLRLLTLDGLDTGWLGEGRSGPRHASRRG